MSTVSVVGIVVENRADLADDVQSIITKYGDSIISRMGVPSSNKYTGIITIALEADACRAEDFVSELKSLGGVTANFCIL